MLHALLQATTRRIGFNVTYCAGHVVSIRDGGAYGMAVQGPLPPGMRADPPATHASLGPGELAAAQSAIEEQHAVAMQYHQVRGGTSPWGGRRGCAPARLAVGSRTQHGRC